MYDPSIGRWLTPDPIGFDGGDPNLYRFVGNSPTNSTDPSGLIDPRNITDGESQTLTGSKFDFMGGKGEVEAFTNVELKGRSYKHAIRLKFSASVPVDDAHWLQIIRFRSFNVADNTENKPRADRAYDYVTGCESGQWMSSNMGIGGAAGLVTSMGPGVRFYTMGQQFGSWSLDTYLDNNPYYDQSGGITLRSSKEISVFDQPVPDVNSVTKNKYMIVEAKSYLVANGKPYYEVEWNLRVTINPAAKADGPLVQQFSYQFTKVSGRPINAAGLPDFLKQPKLPIGIGLNRRGPGSLDYKPPQSFEVSNPIVFPK